MPEIGSAWVSVLPETRGFGSKLNSQIGGDLRRAGTTGGDTYGRGFMSTAGSRFRSGAKGMFSGLVKGGAIAAAVGGAAIGKVLFDSVNAAGDLSETVSKVNQIFGKGGTAIVDWSKTAATEMGQSQQQALDAAATFATFGKAANLSGEDLNNFSTRFTHLATDLASFHNSSPEEAVEAIGAALRGEAEPIRKFGVLLDEATLKAEALSLGILKPVKDQNKILGYQQKVTIAQDAYNKAVSEHGKGSIEALKAQTALGSAQQSLQKATEGTIPPLTQQQKTLAVRSAILKQTTDAQGDFERTSGGMANQQRILTAQWEDAKAKLGRGLLPVVTRLLVWANDMLPKVQVLAGVLQRQLSPVFDRIAGLVRDLVDGGGDLGPTFDQVAKVVRDIYEAFRAAFGDTETIGTFVAYIKDAMATAQSVFKSTVDIVTVLWEKFGSNIVQFLRSTFGNVVTILRGAFQIIKGIFDVVAGVLKGDWSRVWEGIQDILKGAWQIILGAVRQSFNLLRFAFKNAGVVLKAIWGKLWPIIKDLARAGLDAVVGFVRSLPGRFVNALKSLPGVVGAVIRTAFEGWKILVSASVDALVDYVKGIPARLSRLAHFFKEAGKTIIEGFIKGFQGAGGLIGDIAGNVWGALKGLINDAIGSINDALEFKISVPGPAPDISINPPNIPELARGGRATSGTLAIIGEGREPETVFPDSVLAGFLERMSAAANGGRGVGINIEQLVAHDYNDFMVQAQRRKQQAALGGFAS